MSCICTSITALFSLSFQHNALEQQKKEATLTVVCFIKRCYGMLWIFKDHMGILPGQAREQEQALFYRCALASPLIFFSFSKNAQRWRTWCCARTLLWWLLSSLDISLNSKGKQLVCGSATSDTETQGLVCAEQCNTSVSTLPPWQNEP